MTNRNLHIDLKSGKSITLSDGQSLTIGSFATYWDGTPNTPIIDAFVRLAMKDRQGAEAAPRFSIATPPETGATSNTARPCG